MERPASGVKPAKRWLTGLSACRMSLTVCLLFAIFPSAQAHPSRSCRAAPTACGTTRFVLDGNRIYAELAFVRPDGSLHRSLAFVDMGTPSMSLNQPLFRELRLDAADPLVFRIGAMSVTVPASQVSPSPDKPQKLGAETVDAILPAAVLQRFQVVLDYRQRTLTVARPGALESTGVATPFHLDGETGLLAVDAVIDGRPYAITVDSGSAWSWFRQTEVKAWLADRPQWARGVGAVGASNMMMVGDLEATGVMVRVPAIRIGNLTLDRVDALGPGSTDAFPFELFDWYSKKNAMPVLGWIGGNVLKTYRLTIDYPNRTLYWLRQAAPDRDELNQVGLTLRAHAGEYFVAAVATKDGRPTVALVRPGDKLVSIDKMMLKGATWGAIFQALHGAPGAQRRLILDRGGETVRVWARVTDF